MKARAMLPRRMRRWVRARMVECGLPRCRRFSIVHPWLSRRSGIFFHARWYCSPDCLRDALLPQLHLHANQGDPLRRRSARLPFRLVLFERGIVSSAQLEQAREDRAATHPNEDFGDTLLRLNYATQAEIASARAHQAGCPVYAGTGQAVAPEFLPPASLMRSLSAVPVSHAQVKGAPGRLFLGFVYRVDHSLVTALEQISGCQVQACMITRSLHQGQVERLIGAHPPDEPPLVQTSLEGITQGIVAQAIHQRAESVRATRVGHLLWVRLAGGPCNADLLFELSDIPADAMPGSVTDALTLPFRTEVTSPGSRRPIQGRECVTS